jgi:hypothetical protein
MIYWEGFNQPSDLCPYCGGTNVRVIELNDHIIPLVCLTCPHAGPSGWIVYFTRHVGPGFMEKLDAQIPGFADHFAMSLVLEGA